VIGALVARADLTGADRRAMFELFTDYFLGVTRSDFERDLETKDHVVLLRDPGGTIRGFTTLAFTADAASPHPGSWALFSGDTVVDRSHRLGWSLAAAWIDAVFALQTRHGADRIVWLLISSSVRTYRFLPLFFRDHAPRPDVATPTAVAEEMRRLATARYGSAYDETTGLVVLQNPQIAREGATAARAESGEAAFFERVNPGWRRGDELVCHTVVARENLTAAGRRMAGMALRAGAALAR
jgi:hypothetical protein